jgi:gas vesicle protein
MPNHDQPTPTESPSRSERGGTLALTVLAAAVGIGALLLLAPDQGSSSRRKKSRRQSGFVGVAGFVAGVGLTALLAPESGAATRQRLRSTLSRIKVGAVDRMERLRQSEAFPASEDPPVRSIQELGRDSDNVF